MTSKNAKDNIVNKLGLKLGSSRSDVELDKLRKENALLKKTMDDMSKHKGKITESEKSKLLEKILALETIKEKNAQQLLTKEKEIVTLKQQLKSGGNENVSVLQAQLEEKNKEAERREKLFLSLAEETENLKNRLVVVSTKCQELERKYEQDPVLQKSKSDGQVAPGEIAVLQEHLKDALEKNQQWLVYDQQREAYVKGMLAHIFELEEQLKKANQALQEQHKAGNSEETKSVTQQEYYDKLLLTAKRDLEAQKETISQLKDELSVAKKKYEGKCQEVKHLDQQLQSERLNARQCVGEEKQRSGDKVERLKAELQSVKERLEEERKRSSELSAQVNLLQKSLLKQQEEQKRIAVLEHQIQMSAKDFENEKLDRQSLQQQLHKVLKELRKARDQITRLETTNKLHECHISERSPYNKHEFEERASLQDPIFSHSSPVRPSTLLDESFLECPRCRAQYPTSQHRELLAHIDYCSN
nr:PREDICTED: centrosomal protein of 55 kDa [Lepisosteus oculatus]XP_015201718.1 PREDICTED: centrosomal protein of 55 kDa [Lepisosteus oculatus]XP_015201719.1 PREDICTED: centrosomal protein of 55 kDa [Lepisosteus oculatus]XP_015201720.1 PREDICTED: centrosomal protein of 55 kDa [Lepisosteus oculatus]